MIDIDPIAKGLVSCTKHEWEQVGFFPAQKFKKTDTIWYACKRCGARNEEDC